MSRIKWDETGKRLFETGVDRGVFFPVDDTGKYGAGVPWNGLTGVSENPTGAEPNPLYADNIKYLNLFSTEEFGATVEAYTYPPEFKECDGSKSIAKGVYIGQQVRRKFGFAYRTLIGNDVKGQDFGYIIHLVYGCQASPSDKGYQTVNDNPDAITFSWEFSTTPVEVEGHRPTATVEINSTECDPAKLKAFEDVLYGGENEESKLPLPAEVATLLGVVAQG